MADIVKAPTGRRNAAAWSLLGVYSVAHFFYSAVLQAWIRVDGDFASAFPGPLTLRVSRIWSWSVRDWIEPAMARHGMGMTAWNYGPALHALTLPFGLASSQVQALRIILLIDQALVAATFVLWIGFLLPRRESALPWIAIACVWLNHFPLLEGLVGREVEIVELFLITVGIWALRKQRETVAGLAFGIAAMTKFLPVVFVPYLFVKGYRRAGWVAVAAIVSMAIAAQFALGWELSVTLEQLRNEATTPVFLPAYANQSLTNVLSKTFTIFNMHDPRPPTLYPYALRTVGSAVSGLALLGTAWFVVRWRRTRLLEVECALLMIVMCLVPSHANTYYFIFALPGLSIGVAALFQSPAVRAVWLKPVLAAAIALTGFLLPMKAFEIVTHIPGVLIARVLQGWSLPAYGAILTIAILADVHRAQRAGVGPFDPAGVIGSVPPL